MAKTANKYWAGENREELVDHLTNDHCLPKHLIGKQSHERLAKLHDDIHDKTYHYKGIIHTPKLNTVMAAKG